MIPKTSVPVSVFTTDTSLVVSFFMQQVGDISPTSHMQPHREPFQAHRRFPTQPPRQPHPELIPFALPRQIPFFPPSTPQFLPHDAACLFLPAFPAVCLVMAGSNTLRRPARSSCRNSSLPRILHAQLAGHRKTQPTTAKSVNTPKKWAWSGRTPPLAPARGSGSKKCQ